MLPDPPGIDDEAPEPDDMVWKSVLFHENPLDCNPVLRFAEKPRLDETVACWPLMLWFWTQDIGSSIGCSEAFFRVG